MDTKVVRGTGTEEAAREAKKRKEQQLKNKLHKEKNICSVATEQDRWDRAREQEKVWDQVMDEDAAAWEALLLPAPEEIADA